MIRSPPYLKLSTSTEICTIFYFAVGSNVFFKQSHSWVTIQIKSRRLTYVRGIIRNPVTIFPFLTAMKRVLNQNAVDRKSGKKARTVSEGDGIFMHWSKGWFLQLFISWSLSFETYLWNVTKNTFWKAAMIYYIQSKCLLIYEKFGGKTWCVIYWLGGKVSYNSTLPSILVRNCIYH